MLDPALGKMGDATVEFLFTLGGLLALLLFAAFSCARSYFQNGRLRGMEEAIRELSRGLNSHYGSEGSPPQAVIAALEKVKAVADKSWKPSNILTRRYHAELWSLGDAIGEACWLKGHAAGIRRRAPVEGKIRVDLSLNELLQLSWLAHLGFQHMMPNYRDFETHRFSGEEDAKEGALAVSRIEAAIPAKDRPFGDLLIQVKRRQSLIGDWWQAVPSRSIA
jgi:hypothetical protein